MKNIYVQYQNLSSEEFEENFFLNEMLIASVFNRKIFNAQYI